MEIINRLGELWLELVILTSRVIFARAFSNAQLLLIIDLDQIRAILEAMCGIFVPRLGLPRPVLPNSMRKFSNGVFLQT